MDVGVPVAESGGVLDNETVGTSMETDALVVDPIPLPFATVLGDINRCWMNACKVCLS